MAKRSAGRRGSDRHASVGPDVSPPTFRPATRGAEEAERWLLSLGLPTLTRWHAEVAIPAGRDAMFDLNIYAEEWGFVFHHGERASWIRVTDIPFVHGRDDFRLLPRTTDLLAINLLAAELEVEYGLELDRARATIRTNIPNASDSIRDWLLEPPP